MVVQWTLDNKRVHCITFEHPQAENPSLKWLGLLRCIDRKEASVNGHIY